MTAVDVEPDTIAHLDWQPACETPDCEHDHPPATHVLLVVKLCTCWPPELMCDPCTARLRDWLRRHDHAGQSICRRCHAAYWGKPADVFHIRPLGPR